MASSRRHAYDAKAAYDQAPGTLLEVQQLRGDATPSPLKPSAHTLPSSSGWLSAVWRFLQHWLPILRWMPLYNVRRDLLSDVTAGLCLSLLAAPEALSYAGIAGVSPVRGLYTAMVAPLAHAWVTTSPQTVTGPTTIMSILTQRAMPSEWAGQPVAASSPLYDGIASLLALCVGVCQCVIALTGSAGLARAVGPPVVLGFTSGSALLIASTQFANVLGLPKCVSASGTCSFPSAFAHVVQQLGQVQPAVPAASAVCLLLLIGVKYVLPRYLPPAWKLLGNTGPLVLLCLCTPVMYVYAHALGKAGLQAVGTIPAGLPAPSSPFPSQAGTSSDLQSLFAASIPLALIGYMESLSIARTLARTHARAEIDDTQEMLAAGLGNMAVAMAQGYPVTGSFSRSAVNAGSGAITPLSGAVSSAILALALAVMTPALQYMPKVALAAIVLVVIVRLIDPAEAVAMYRTDRLDFLVALIVFIITATVDVTPGILTGIALQWLFALLRGYEQRSQVLVVSATDRDSEGRPKPPSAGWSSAIGGVSSLASLNADGSDHVPTTTQTDCILLRFGPAINFAHCERLRSHVMDAVARYTPSVLILDGECVASMDSAGANEMLHLSRDLDGRCSVIVAGLRATFVTALRAAADAHGARVEDRELDADVSTQNHGAAALLSSSELLAVCSRFGDLIVADDMPSARAAVGIFSTQDVGGVHEPDTQRIPPSLITLEVDSARLARTPAVDRVVETASGHQTVLQRLWRIAATAVGDATLIAQIVTRRFVLLSPGRE